MIVFLANPWFTGCAAAAVLAVEAWFLNGHHLPHLPSGLGHVLATQVVTAVVTVIFLTEMSRAHDCLTATTNGDHHAQR